MKYFYTMIYVILFALKTPSFANETSNKLEILLKDDSSDKRSSIRIDVPRDALISDRADTTTNGVNLTVFYPYFTYSTDIVNHNYGISCAGYCNGRMLLSINFNASMNNLMPSPYYILEGLKKYSKNYRILSIESIINSDGIRIFDLGISKNFHDSPRLNEEFYFKSDLGDKLPHTAVTCFPNAAYRNCKIDFSIECDRRISVKISSIPYEDLGNAIKIKEEFEEYIKKMLHDEECK